MEESDYDVGDLHSGIVNIVLDVHFPARKAQQADKGIAENGVAQVPDMGTSPQIVQMFKDGWVQLAADQQPFQQGYLPILSLCEQIVYGLAPINVDTSAGFVTSENYAAVADLAKEGLR